MFYLHTHGRRFLVERSAFRPRSRAWQATDTRSMAVIATAARHSDILDAVSRRCEMDERIAEIRARG